MMVIITKTSFTGIFNLYRLTRCEKFAPIKNQFTLLDTGVYRSYVSELSTMVKNSSGESSKKGHISRQGNSSIRGSKSSKRLFTPKPPPVIMLLQKVEMKRPFASFWRNVSIEPRLPCPIAMSEPTLNTLLKCSLWTKRTWPSVSGKMSPPVRHCFCLPPVEWPILATAPFCRNSGPQLRSLRRRVLNSLGMVELNLKEF